MGGCGSRRDEDPVMSIKHWILTLLARGFSIPIVLGRKLSGNFVKFMRLSKAFSLLRSVNSTVQFDGSVTVLGTRNITIGNHSRIGDRVEFETQGAGRILLGENTRLNRGCTVCSYSSVIIGDYTLIGEYTSIRDANHGIRKGTFIRLQPHDSKQIVIGRDVWIGRGSCILPGVTIGDGSVIGANSVVTKDIPAFSIAVGAPARVIRERT